jgi:hypothetical protein
MTMRDLNADEMSGMWGDDDLGEVYEAPDGNLYEWVEGVDAWGTQVGFWQGVSDIDGDDPSIDGLGALYQTPDGALYRIQGLSEEEAETAAASEDASQDAAAEDKAADPPAPKMGPGRPGEIRVGPDGKKYRWVLGMGAGGKRTGFWRRLRPRPAGRGGGPAPRARGGAPARRQGRGQQTGRKRKPLLKRLLPIAKVAASLIPFPGAGQAVKAGLTVADKLLTRKGVSGYDLGALYQAPDGSLFQVQGFASDDLDGSFDNDGFDGLYADELDGPVVDGELEGPAQEEIQGIADTAPPFVGEDDVQGYVPEDRVGGMDAYVPEPPRKTRMFDSSRELPEHWKPVW